VRDFLLCLIVLYTMAANAYIVGMLAGWHIAWLRSQAGQSGYVDPGQAARLLRPPRLWPERDQRESR
jgi:hypothetical protein